MFAHFSAPKVYFSSPFFSIDPFHVVNSFLSHSLLLLVASANFEPSLFFFQMDTISTFFEVALRHPIIARCHTSSTVCILCNIKHNYYFFFPLIQLFMFFSNLEHLPKKSIYTDISFDSKFMLNFHITTPYVKVLLTIEL